MPHHYVAYAKQILETVQSQVLSDIWRSMGQYSGRGYPGSVAAGLPLFEECREFLTVPPSSITFCLSTLCLQHIYYYFCSVAPVFNNELGCCAQRKQSAWLGDEACV